MRSIHTSRFTDYVLRRHPGLLIAVLVYLALAFSYFFIVPIFEGPDEWTHTGHVKYIAEGNGLPVMLPGQGIWGGQQPPLYFAIGALLVQPFELSGVEAYEENARNPHASIGYALDPGNKNNYLHTPAENFPYRGLSLTVHVLRLYSMTYGLVALVFTYLTALELFNHQARQAQPAPYSLLPTAYSPLFATAVAFFIACQPMFAFITASVANEPANIAFSAVGLWLAQRYVLWGPTAGWKRAVALGVVLGLISLSKMTGLSFGLVVVVAMLQAAVSTHKQPGAARLLWRDGFIIGLLFLAVGGWWYWRNYKLYGDFFQAGLYKIYFNVDPQPVTLDKFLYILSTGEVSFWATFGWLNIVAPDWLYSLYRIISRVGLLGVVLTVIAQVVQKAKQRAGKKQTIEPMSRHASRITPYLSRPTFHVSTSPFLIHLLFPVALAFSLTRLVAIEGGLQGRQLLPALGSVAILIVWGWGVLIPNRVRLPVMTILGAIVLGLAAWLPFGVVAPAYVPKPLLAEADLPPDLPHLNWTYNGEMRLVGARIGADVVRPGQRVPVTVYWQALKPMETDYSVFVHLIGRDYRPVGQMNTYPGLGLRPSGTLQPGQIVVDTYPVLVDDGAEAPTRLLVNVGLFDFDEPGRPGIPAVSSGEERLPPTVGQLKLIPAQWPGYPATPPVAEFADHIWLVDYSLETCRAGSDRCQIVLKWLARGQPSTDYTVFIQLWRNGEKMAGFDAPPLANDYPTGLWASGEVIIDPHPLDLTVLPPGRYGVLAGLYKFATGERLAATAGGASLPDDAVELGTIWIK